MSFLPLSIDAFKTALVNRYLQPLEHLQSRAELERLLEERDVFRFAAIFVELVEQVQLIVAELGRLTEENGIERGFDLSEQGKLVCSQLLEFGQRLPLSLPQAVVEER